jgi:hypothetical protein
MGQVGQGPVGLQQVVDALLTALVLGVSPSCGEVNDQTADDRCQQRPTKQPERIEDHRHRLSPVSGNGTCRCRCRCWRAYRRRSYRRDVLRVWQRSSITCWRELADVAPRAQHETRSRNIGDLTFQIGHNRERLGRCGGTGPAGPEAVASEFLRWLGICHGARWVDVGCGTGAVAAEARKLADHALLRSIFGGTEGFHLVDAEPFMAKQAAGSPKVNAPVRTSSGQSTANSSHR